MPEAEFIYGEEKILIIPPPLQKIVWNSFFMEFWQTFLAEIFSENFFQNDFDYHHQRMFLKLLCSDIVLNWIKPLH